MKNDRGIIVAQSKNGTFYIRHDIIFGKAGDVFFMPRKLPAHFKFQEETMLSKEQLEQFEAMSDKF